MKKLILWLTVAAMLAGIGYGVYQYVDKLPDYTYMGVEVWDNDKGYPDEYTKQAIDEALTRYKRTGFKVRLYFEDRRFNHSVGGVEYEIQATSYPTRDAVYVGVQKELSQVCEVQTIKVDSDADDAVQLEVCASRWIRTASTDISTASLIIHELGHIHLYELKGFPDREHTDKQFWDLADTPPVLQ